MLNLFKCFYSKDSSILLKAYKTYVRPILEYGTTVFNPHKKKSIQSLEGVQNSFTRKLLLRQGHFDYTTIPKFTERNAMLGLSSLASRRKRNDLLMVFKILNKLVRINNGLFILKPSSTRGSAVKLYLPFAKSSIRTNFFVHRAGAEYRKLCRNDLPSTLRSFKRFIGRVLKN